jgi:hypothetical protein
MGMAFGAGGFVAAIILYGISYLFMAMSGIESYEPAPRSEPPPEQLQQQSLGAPAEITQSAAAAHMQAFQYQPHLSQQQGDCSNVTNKAAMMDYPPFGESEEDCCLQNPSCGCVCTCANNDAPLKFGKKQLRIAAIFASFLFVIMVIPSHEYIFAVSKELTSTLTTLDFLGSAWCVCVLGDLFYIFVDSMWARSHRYCVGRVSM